MKITKEDLKMSYRNEIKDESKTYLEWLEDMAVEYLEWMGDMLESISEDSLSAFKENGL